MVPPPLPTGIDVTNENTQIIQASGTFRIRTVASTPDDDLHIANNTQAGPALRLENQSVSTDSNTIYASINFEGNDNSAGANGIRGSIVGKSESSNGAMGLLFSTASAGSANTERMRINSSGNVGIGTSSPSAPLHIVASAVAEMRYGAIGPSSNSALRISRNDSTTTSGNPLGYLEFGGNDATGAVDTSFAYVGAEASGTHAAGDNPTDLVFGTTADGSATVTERMRINSAGAVKINGGVLELGGEGIVSGSIHSQESLYINSDSNGTPEPAPIVFGRGRTGFSGGTEDMRLDGAGNLLVGQTTASSNAVGTSLRSDGRNFYCADGNYSGHFNRKTSDGAIVHFAKDDTVIGSIGVIHGNNLFIGAPSHSGLQFGSSIVYPTGGSTGDANDATVDIGASGQRFKDLYLSGGLRGTTLTFSNLAGTERMRISGAALLVGKTAANSGTAGVEASAAAFNATVSGDTVSRLNRLSSDGEILRFQKDTATVGSIGTVGGSVYIDGGSSNYSVMLASDFRPRTSNGAANNDAAVDLGDSSARWKDLYLSGGVYLGGTGAANLLDDYEEGTFTPAITFGGASTGVTYTARFGRYIKIGTLVYVNIALNLTNKGSSTGDAKVTGLPFTQSSAGVNFPNLNLRSVAGITFTNCLYATANDGATEIQLMDDNGSGTQTNLTNSDFTTGAEFNITGVYEAA
jgi:hypothetical protein